MFSRYKMNFSRAPDFLRVIRRAFQHFAHFAVCVLISRRVKMLRNTFGECSGHFAGGRNFYPDVTYYPRFLRESFRRGFYVGFLPIVSDRDRGSRNGSARPRFPCTVRRPDMKYLASLPLSFFLPQSSARLLLYIPLRRALPRQRGDVRERWER